MAYTDPALIRNNVVKLSFNDPEAALVELAAAKAGMQVAEYCRTVALEKLRELDMTSLSDGGDRQCKSH